MKKEHMYLPTLNIICESKFVYATTKYKLPSKEKSSPPDKS